MCLDVKYHAENKNLIDRGPAERARKLDDNLFKNNIESVNFISWERHVFVNFNE